MSLSFTALQRLSFASSSCAFNRWFCFSRVSFCAVRLCRQLVAYPRFFKLLRRFLILWASTFVKLLSRLLRSRMDIVIKSSSVIISLQPCQFCGLSGSLLTVDAESSAKPSRFSLVCNRLSMLSSPTRYPKRWLSCDQLELMQASLVKSLSKISSMGEISGKSSSQSMLYCRNGSPDCSTVERYLLKVGSTLGVAGHHPIRLQNFDRFPPSRSCKTGNPLKRSLFGELSKHVTANPMVKLFFQT